MEIRPAPGTRCQNASVRDPEKLCGCLLGAHGDHEQHCLFGPLVNARHNGLADTLALFVQETGAVVRREAYVPEFSTSEVLAYSDYRVET